MNKLLGILILLASSTVLAAIYVNQTPSGGVEYTDTPGSNSSQVVVPPINSITSARPAAPQPATDKQAAGGTTETPAQGTASNTATYTTFEIASPKDQETITNQPVIPVQLTVEPNMQPGDKIQLMLDGAPAGTPTGTIYQELGLVERGSHTLGAVIKNSKGESIKQSATITIFVQRNSTILSPAMQKPKTN